MRSAMAFDPRIPPYLGRVLTGDSAPGGTCFQVASGVLVTAWHVLDGLGAGSEGATVPVDPLQGGVARTARVERTDPLHDLAVLVIADPLPDSVVGLAASDEAVLGTSVVITGVPDLDDPGHSYRYLDAGGEWAGGATRDDQIPLGRVVASSVMRGMSGAPVVSRERGHYSRLVLGVVSARYNSADGWGRDSVWVARTEDLASLLVGLGEVAVIRRGWAGASGLTLSVTEKAVLLRGASLEVSGSHDGVRPSLADAMRGLRAGRDHLTGPHIQDLMDATPLAVQATPAAVGRLLAESFLPAPIATALAEVVSNAERRWAPVRLGIDLAEAPGPLRELPWETLALPGTSTPLVLHPLLAVYRAQAADRPPALTLPGHLRIVIAISAPLDGGSGVLDYERELRNMVAAVRGARQGQARVRIVHFATTAEIHAALAAEPAHVLHLSGHGRPGAIELEDDDGNARVLDARRFAEEAIPPGRMPPVIALSACHSDAATVSDPSFAAALIGLGASVVIGTETAVTDVYATRVFSRIYAALADAGVTDVISAVAQARRTVQQQLSNSADPRDQRLARLGEWAVLTVLATSGSPILGDPSAALAADDQTVLRETPRLPAGLLARDTGQFVGRRSAQRRWPAGLLSPVGTGLVLYGIGGVGKTTLAAELVRRIVEREPGWLPVVAISSMVGGNVSVDSVFTSLAQALRRRSGGATPALDHAAAQVERSDIDWQDRLAALREDLLDTMPILIVLDNFEDNLAPDEPSGRPGWRTVADRDLAALLAGLVTRPGRCRLLITSRYPFVLPTQAERVLTFQPIGPLSKAETMKLAWALPALDKLTEPELERVWRMVGGHPRCLEYVDALLSGGRSTYPDVTARLAANLAARPDVPDLDEWFAAHRGLEPALAETLTLAADEILLDQLLASLSTTSGAEALLLGVSVYRFPVDDAGLLFQLGIPDSAAEIKPDYKAAQKEIDAILVAAGKAGDRAELAQLPADVQEALRPHLDVLNTLPFPPLRAPDGLRRLQAACTASSLLAVDTSSDAPKLFVHRWTASELHQRWVDSGRAGQLTAAHRRAAQYWQWRAQTWPQHQTSSLDSMIEASYHLFAAGEIAEAEDLTDDICRVLRTQSAWDREDALIRDTLTKLRADYNGRANWIRKLGEVAYSRGRRSEAAQLYQEALAIDQDTVALDPTNIGFQLRLSASYTDLGDLAADAGRTAEVTRLYQQALAIREQVAARHPTDSEIQRALAVSTERLGDVAWDSGETAEAARRYQKALTIREQLAARHPTDTRLQSDLSLSYSKLGDLAERVGDNAAAAKLHQQALTIREQLAARHPTNADVQDDLSLSYTHLGTLAEHVGDNAAAVQLHQQALAIREQLVQLDPTNIEFQYGLAISYQRLGDAMPNTGNNAEVARKYQQSLSVSERLMALDAANTDFQRVHAASYDRLGELAQEAENATEAIRLHQQALTIRERLVTLDPTNTAFQRGLMVSYARLGDLAQQSGDIAEATQLHQRAMAISERLTALDSTNIMFQTDLSISHARVGNLAQETGDNAQAAFHYGQALAITQRLARANPTSIEIMKDVVRSYEQIARLARKDGKGNDVQIYQQGVEFCQRVYGSEHPITQAFRGRAHGTTTEQAD